MKQQIIDAKSWEDRYRLIIQAGRNLSKPDEQMLNSMQNISGCEAKLWFKSIPQNNRTFQFQAYSEARIMNGLLWLLLQAINGKTAEQLATFQLADYFKPLGITSRLSATRLNGLKQIEQILHSL